MALFKRFSSTPSSKPFLGLSLVLTTGLLLSANGTGCGSEQACFYWTEAEGSCPSQKDALSFFTSPFNCSNEIVSVDSEGTFDGDVCCYAVTKTGDQFNDCFIEPGPPTPGTVTTGIGGAGASGGAGGIGGGGGTGGTGGNSCAGCAEFFTNTNPPPLCASSVMLYEALTSCQCSGPCASACGGNVCMGQPATSECDTCMLNQNTGCGTLVSDCLNDN